MRNHFDMWQMWAHIGTSESYGVWKLFAVLHVVCNVYNTHAIMIICYNAVGLTWITLALTTRNIGSPGIVYISTLFMTWVLISIHIRLSRKLCQCLRFKLHINSPAVCTTRYVAVDRPQIIDTSCPKQMAVILDHNLEIFFCESCFYFHAQWKIIAFVSMAQSIMGYDWFNRQNDSSWSKDNPDHWWIYRWLSSRLQ